MRKYVAGIQYVGTSYSGWQKQKHSISVQEHVENALSKIAAENIEIFCAGRTDSGVHAFEQIIHFETHSYRDDYSWRMGSNSSLPDDIRILWCHEANETFHARFSATSRQYRYVIYNTRSDSALLNKRVNWIPYKLDVEKMNESAQFLLGEQDFTSFRAAGCQSNTPFRNIIRISVKRENDFVFIDIESNAFLHHMVRNIVGSLIEVGRERQNVLWIKQLLELKDRNKAGVTAPACGLYFIKAMYPAAYNLQQISFKNKNLFPI